MTPPTSGAMVVEMPMLPHRPRAGARRAFVELVGGDRERGRSQPATERGKQKHRETGDQHALAAEAVGQRAGRQQVRGERYHIREALTTHSTSAKPAWKSRAMDGSAAATTLVSSVISTQVADAVSSTKRAAFGERESSNMAAVKVIWSNDRNGACVSRHWHRIAE